MLSLTCELHEHLFQPMVREHHPSTFSNIDIGIGMDRKDCQLAISSSHHTFCSYPHRLWEIHSEESNPSRIVCFHRGTSVCLKD